MKLKEVLKNKVPKEKQETTEFNILLKEVKRKNLSDVKALKMYIDVEFKKCKTLFETHKGETCRREKPAQARRMKFLKLIKEKILSYL